MANAVLHRQQHGVSTRTIIWVTFVVKTVHNNIQIILFLLLSKKEFSRNASVQIDILGG